MIEALVVSRVIASAISSGDDTWRTGRPLFRGGEIVDRACSGIRPPGRVDQAGGDRIDAPRREFDGQQSHDRLGSCVDDADPGGAGHLGAGADRADERDRGSPGQVRQCRLRHGQHRDDLLVEPLAQLGQEAGERAHAGGAGDGLQADIVRPVYALAARTITAATAIRPAIAGPEIRAAGS